VVIDFLYPSTASEGLEAFLPTYHTTVWRQGSERAGAQPLPDSVRRLPYLRTPLLMSTGSGPPSRLDSDDTVPDHGRCLQGRARVGD
jgi:hypothetical protein